MTESTSSASSVFWPTCKPHVAIHKLLGGVPPRVRKIESYEAPIWLEGCVIGSIYDRDRVEAEDVVDEVTRSQVYTVAVVGETTLPSTDGDYLSFSWGESINV